MSEQTEIITGTKFKPGFIKFECCHCGQHIEAPEELDGSETPCPGCGKNVKVRKLVVEVTTSKPTTPRRPKSERIKDSAASFVTLSIMALIGAGGSLVFGCLYLMSNETGTTLFILAGGLVAFAFWMQLLAQLYYIRAELAVANERAK